MNFQSLGDILEKTRGNFLLLRFNKSKAGEISSVSRCGRVSISSLSLSIFLSPSLFFFFEENLSPSLICTAFTASLSLTQPEQRETITLHTTFQSPLVVLRCSLHFTFSSFWGIFFFERDSFFPRYCACLSLSLSIHFFPLSR